MIGRPWTLAGPADDRRADRDRRGAGPPRPVQEPPELVRMIGAPARGSHRGQRPRGRTQRPDGWQQPRTKTCPSRPQNPCGPGGVHGWTGWHPNGPGLTKTEEGPGRRGRAAANGHRQVGASTVWRGRIEGFEVRRIDGCQVRWPWPVRPPQATAGRIMDEGGFGQLPVGTSGSRTRSWPDPSRSWQAAS